MGVVHPDDVELIPGQGLGPYELLVPIGAGGMAHVWVARHVDTGAVFALKMLMPHLAVNAAFREMFFDEARIASRIRHGNVCTTYDLLELEGVLTIVMEWVDGTSLLRLLRPGAEEHSDAPRIPLPLRHAVKIVAETSAGLHAAHELLGDDGRPLSVVHRDVSPHNVLLTRDGRVKVTDFGVAKALGKLHMTIAGQVKGKLAYMSPEQLVGAGVDRRSDVFALGTVLYETTTGQRPFQGLHDPQVMSAIIMGNFHPPSAVVPSYPPALEEIVLRAMASEPGARYTNALQLRQALEGWLDATGPTFGGNQIARLLRERCGAELDARTEALSVPPPSLASRRVARSEPAGGANANSNAPAGVGSPTGKLGGVGVGGAVLAVLLGLALGLAVLFHVRETRRAHAAAMPVSPGVSPGLTGSTASDISTPPPTTTPSIPAATPRASASVMNVGELDDVPPAPAPSPTPTPPPRPREVKLVMPDNARLIMDGRLLPSGTTSVGRPDAGVKAVIVRAEGRDDTVVVVDSKSPDEVEVTMPVHVKRILRPIPTPSVVTPPPNPYE